MTKDKSEKKMVDQVKEKIKNSGFKEKLSDAFGYAENNVGFAVMFAVAIIGLFLSFFKPFVGTLLVGVVAGVYYVKPIACIYFRSTSIESQTEVFRLCIIGTFVLTLLFYLPFFVIGAVVAASVHLFFNKDSLEEIEEEAEAEAEAEEE
jgi:Na+-transporting methylmalonyl-CoA/oxaloacetate decarboxylase beta subunit